MYEDLYECKLPKSNPVYQLWGKSSSIIMNMESLANRQKIEIKYRKNIFFPEARNIVEGYTGKNTLNNLH